MEPRAVSPSPSSTQSLYGSSREATGSSNTETSTSGPGQSLTNRRSIVLVRAASAKARPQELTTRDIGILTALDRYRYLDTDQIRQLFFQGQRRCQLRLKWLAQNDLAIRWLAMEPPGWTRRHSVYALSPAGARVLAARLNEDPRIYVRRSQHAIHHQNHLLHDLEANGFFVALATTHQPAERGLWSWVGEDGCRRTYRQRGDHLTPDGFGRYLVRDRQILLHLEWDRGTESPQRIADKARSYVRHFAGRQQAEYNNILFVAPQPGREGSLNEAILRAAPTWARACCTFWTTNLPLLRSVGVLGQAWFPVLNSHPEEVRSCLVDMPSLEYARFAIDDCIGADSWWERRLRGGESA
jgi:hypothetical protein